MKSTKLLGIWMDHSIAHLIELPNQNNQSTTIESHSMSEDDEINTKDETLLQNKEQNYLSNYFKKINEVIINYDDVLLFGPTDAKTELFNLIDSDHHFDRIKIEVKSADKMTENQMQAFVKDHFKSLNKYSERKKND